MERNSAANAVACAAASLESDLSYEVRMSLHELRRASALEQLDAWELSGWAAKDPEALDWLRGPRTD